jgi:hypothetical protein
MRKESPALRKACYCILCCITALESAADVVRPAPERIDTRIRGLSRKTVENILLTLATLL